MVDAVAVGKQMESETKKCNEIECDETLTPDDSTQYYVTPEYITINSIHCLESHEIELNERRCREYDKTESNEISFLTQKNSKTSDEMQFKSLQLHDVT